MNYFSPSKNILVHIERLEYFRYKHLRGRFATSHCGGVDVQEANVHPTLHFKSLQNLWADDRTRWWVSDWRKSRVILMTHKTVNKNLFKVLECDPFIEIIWALRGGAETHTHTHTGYWLRKCRGEDRAACRRVPLPWWARSCSPLPTWRHLRSLRQLPARCCRFLTKALPLP